MGSGAGRLLKADRPMHHQLHHSLYTKCNSNSVTILKDRQTGRQTDWQTTDVTDRQVAVIATYNTHTHTRLTALCSGLPRWAGTRKVNQSGYYWSSPHIKGQCTLLCTVHATDIDVTNVFFTFFVYVTFLTLIIFSPTLIHLSLAVYFGARERDNVRASLIGSVALPWIMTQLLVQTGDKLKPADAYGDRYTAQIVAISAAAATRQFRYRISCHSANRLFAYGRWL